MLQNYYCCNSKSFQIEVEVERLNLLKATKLKELIFKRQSELEEIYQGVHMDIDTDKAQLLITLMESGLLLAFLSLFLFIYFQWR